MMLATTATATRPRATTPTAAPATRQLHLLRRPHQRLIINPKAEPGRSATPTRTADLSPSSSQEDSAAVSASSSIDDSDGGPGPSSSSSSSRAERYNALMRERMGWRDPYQYHPELGLYHHEVAPGVIVGTQPRGRREVDRLIEETGATAILNLQEDKDAEHWGVDLGRVVRHAESRGLMHLRAPARDFDGDSLRGILPRAAALLQRELLAAAAVPVPSSSSDGAAAGGGRVYVHCTAGLGRAPAVAIAWRYWFFDEGREGGEQGGDGERRWSLDAEYGAVTRVRPCGPRREAILGATADLLRRAGMLGGEADEGEQGEEAAASLTAAQRAAVQREAMRALSLD